MGREIKGGGREMNGERDEWGGRYRGRDGGRAGGRTG